MPPRKLGSSGLEVAPLALGGKLLDAFVADGFNLVDTADMYSRWVPGHQGGESETILGNWFKRSGNRGKVVLATKVGMDMGGGDVGLSRAYIFRAVERSLQRLQTDHIDLYQAHKDDESTPLEETLAAFAELIKQGKVRAIGASNYTAPRLAAALEVSRSTGLPSYQCLQPHYNLCERAGYEEALEPLCQESGLGVIPYFSLASGFLTGKYRSEQDLAKSPRGQSVKKYLNPRGQRILAALDAVAAQYGSTPTGVALAWLLARPSVTAPIASATSPAQLSELLAATRLKLDAAAVELLNQASG
jgi:aryl-alcohol dehydrogenase-like predicted oxidoreductase